MATILVDYNSVQYLRACSVLIQSPGGDTLELADLHVKFDFKHAAVGTPQFAVIRIYNLEHTLETQITKEFTNVQIQAGYTGNVGLIFIGKIRQFKIGRENATDTYLDIIAADGDEAHNFAVVNATIRSIGGNGVTQLHQFQTALNAMDQYGVETGYTPNFQGNPLPRAKVMYGMAKDYLHNLATASQCCWGFQDGKVNMVPLNNSLPGDPIQVNAASGMINTPRQTLEGIEVRCLIKPQIKWKKLIKLDNKLIQQVNIETNIAYSVPGNNYLIDVNTGQNYGIATDGIYEVYGINIVGDTRGQEWYMDLICANPSFLPPLEIYPAALPSTAGD